MAGKTKAALAVNPARMYPALEQFLESRERTDAGLAFAGIKAELGKLAGPRASTGKKVQAAVERAEGLLAQLFEVKDKLAQQKRAGKPRK